MYQPWLYNQTFMGSNLSAIKYFIPLTLWRTFSFLFILKLTNKKDIATVLLINRCDIFIINKYLSIRLVVLTVVK